MEGSNTRDKILKGAEGLFTKYGVRSISMDDIARHLSVSKKTLYQHFTDKEDIVTLVFESVLSESRKEFEAIRQTAENAIDELAKLSVCLKKSVDEINPSNICICTSVILNLSCEKVLSSKAVSIKAIRTILIISVLISAL